MTMPSCAVPVVDLPLEVIESHLLPYFDAVRDFYLTQAVAPGHPGFSRLRALRFQVTPEAHDADRHFAACRDDGKLLLLAPELVALPEETTVAILAHELGHAVDYLYPGAWTWPLQEAGPVHWIGERQEDHAAAWRASFGKRGARSRGRQDDVSPAANWGRAWASRTPDQVEWTADGIAWAVTGKRPLYGGPCMVQRFAAGVPRPAGLR